MFLYPDHLLKSVIDLTDEFLARHEIRGIIFDIDNTLVGYHTPKPTAAICALLEHLREKGIKMAIASNNSGARVRRFATDLGLAAYHRSAKPLPFRLRKIVADFALPKEQVALVGDQIFTDIWGGNWAGLQTILVEPADALEKNIFFRVKRAMERPIIAKRRRMEK